MGSINQSITVNDEEIGRGRGDTVGKHFRLENVQSFSLLSSSSFLSAVVVDLQKKVFPSKPQRTQSISCLLWLLFVVCFFLP